jgi:polyhydroxybutyrate depolymerase
VKTFQVLCVLLFALLAACAPAQPAALTPSAAVAAPSGTPALPPTPAPTLASTLAATSQPTISFDGGPSGGPPQPQQTLAVRNLEGSLNVQGLNRTYRLHLPPSSGKGSLPLVIALHAQGDNSSELARVSQLDAVSDRAGFLVAYPDGTGITPSWNAGDCCGDALAQKVDDVAFVRGLIEALAGTYRADTARVFVVGLSEGGMLAQRLGVDLSGPQPNTAPGPPPANPGRGLRLAGIAVVAARLPGGLSALAQPLPVVLLQGTADPQLSAEAAAASLTFWRQSDGCGFAPQRQETGVLSQETYTGCKNGVTVVRYSVKGGGHAWPQTMPSAAELIWSFFAAVRPAP